MPSLPSRLSELPAGYSALIESLEPGFASLTRLRELGLVPGTRVKIIRRAPFGEPVEIGVRGSTLAMRNEDASRIRIASVQS